MVNALSRFDGIPGSIRIFVDKSHGYAKILLIIKIYVCENRKQKIYVFVFVRKTTYDASRITYERKPFAHHNSKKCYSKLF